MTRVSLNVDMGELADEPEELYALATVVNIACGGHAGDTASMSAALARAKKHGTWVAAHPSYPDRANFGRASMSLDVDSLRTSIGDQFHALCVEASKQGVSVVTVKPHGALYHEVNRDIVLARAFLDGIGPGLSVVGPPSGALRDACNERNITLLAEGFADRAYNSDGSLVARSQPHALIVDVEKCAQQAVTLAQSNTVQTICVHGDTPNAVAIARAVRDALAANGLLL